jgi:formylglycine-generating enzyme required for sulfatase activity
MQNASYTSPGFDQTDRDPVVCVTWEDAQSYVRWLSERTGYAYRLPTDAEWEYAARARTRTARWWGDRADDACANANVADRAAARVFNWAQTADQIHRCTDGYVNTSPVGTFRANPFGLHDMLGNAWQWVEDCFQRAEGRPADERAVSRSACGISVIRGGSWQDPPRMVRSGWRRWAENGVRSGAIGFRVARTLQP